MRETETEERGEKENQEEGNGERYSIPHQEERMEDRPWMNGLPSELSLWSVKRVTEQVLWAGAQDRPG